MMAELIKFGSGNMTVARVPYDSKGNVISANVSDL